MSGSIDDNQFEAPSSDSSRDPSPNAPQESGSQGSDPQESDPQESDPQESDPQESDPQESTSSNREAFNNPDNGDERAWAEAEQALSLKDSTKDSTYRIASPSGRQAVGTGSEEADSEEAGSKGGSPEEAVGASMALTTSPNGTTNGTGQVPIALVETAFLASTASLFWLISYYLSVVPWMRIFFPAPIALVYLRWGNRSAWMAAIVSCLLLSVLMGPYLSILFLIPYGLLGVQLGALWRRGATWSVSIGLGTLLSTLSFFFRVALLSAFIGEDLWVYLTGRITDLLEWVFNLLVNWGFVGIGSLGQPSLALVQIATVVMVIASDIVYLFTVHLTVWLMFERLKTPIPAPPQWVQVLLEEE